MRNANASENAQLIQVGIEIVEFCGSRPKQHWNLGHKLTLYDGRETYSNSPEFRHILSTAHREKYGKVPSFGSVTSALRGLNRCRFQNRAFS